MSELKLENCPFCGGETHITGVSDFRLTSPRTGHRAACSNCHAYGGAFATREEAIKSWNRRTQPEATKPAQDLGAAILALPLPDAWFRSMKRGGMLSEDGYSLAQVRELLKAAAALASPADALVAGDSELLNWLEDKRATLGLKFDASGYILAIGKQAVSTGVTARAAIRAAIQAQKDGHG